MCRKNQVLTAQVILSSLKLIFLPISHHTRHEQEERFTHIFIEECRSFEKKKEKRAENLSDKIMKTTINCSTFLHLQGIFLYEATSLCWCSAVVIRYTCLAGICRSSLTGLCVKYSLLTFFMMCYSFHIHSSSSSPPCWCSLRKTFMHF